MSAHFTHRRSPLEAVSHHRSQIRVIDRPHITDASRASVFQVILLMACILLLLALIIGLVFSCLNHFEWFRHLIDPDRRFRYNAERAERTGLMAGREIGGFARGFGQATHNRGLLCERSGYLGGGRGYGWRTQAYGDGVGDAEREEGDSGYGSVREGGRRDSGGSGRSIKHRDDCDGQCGLASRGGNRAPSPE